MTEKTKEHKYYKNKDNLCCPGCYKLGKEEAKQEFLKDEISFLDNLIAEGIVCKDMVDRIKKLKSKLEKK
jgi:hypothetical protein